MAEQVFIPCFLVFEGALGSGYFRMSLRLEDTVEIDFGADMCF